MATDPQAKYLTRIQELSEVSTWGDTAAILAWAINVLTVVEAVCGSEDTRTRTLRGLIEKRAGTGHMSGIEFVEGVKGIALGVRSDMEGQYFLDLRGRIRSEVEGEFLGQARSLLEDDLKDPAAMLIGAVLEDALRQLCQKHSIPEGQNIEAMNEPLRAAGVYGLPQKQQITAWAAIRNKAGHGRFDQYAAEEVRVMHQGVCGFIAKYVG